MDVQLTGFELKIDKVLAFCRALREENRQLRGQIAGLENEKRRLAEKIDTTVMRLETLMERLPNS